MPFRLIPTAPNDGYTLKGRWAYSNVGFITFTYRPALPKRSYEYAAANKRTGEEKETEIIAIIAEHLIDWKGIVDESGQPAKVSLENLKRVPQPFLEHLLDCITGYHYEEMEKDEKN